MNRREEILNGVLRTPQQIIDMVEYDPVVLDNIFQTIWHNYLRDKTTCTTTQFDKMDSPKAFNKFIYYLCKAGWIYSFVEANYGYLQLNKDKLLKWVTEEELLEVKRQHRFNKYRLKVEKSVLVNKAKYRNKIYDVEFERNGFKQAGNVKFKYNTKYLNTYLYEIADNVLKGLDTDTAKEITYEEVVCDLMGYYAVRDNVYTLGNNISDSRGRSVFNATKKVFNPISSKDARALMLTEPEPLTKQGLVNVYGFISNLLGYKTKTWEEKIGYGEYAYKHRILPDIDLSTQNGKKELHKLIYLKRLYERLSNDNFETKWDIPIETDATASVIQLVGILTGHKDYLEKTNILGDELEDIWTIEGVSRQHVKKCLTPRLYGSTKTTKQLWDDNNLEYTQKEVDIIEHELNHGIFKVAKDFKDFIISNVKPTNTMKVKIWNESFTIHCNRYKFKQTILKEYPIFTSSQNVIKKITRKLELVPDLEQFKRYFVTLLIHNLDSQIANDISLHTKNCIPIHDAFIVHPNYVDHVKKLYTDKLKDMYYNRDTILEDYFNSIGIKEKMKLKVNNLSGEFIPLKTCLN